MQAKEVLSAALELESGIVTDRRWLHRNPETGRVLPQTKAYVRRRLEELGYAPEECGPGLVATITGSDTGRCILLRADMDALAITEQADIPFASENGNMHACGHDMHTAMLLGAAALLQQYRKQLQGTVKLVFQPDEEGLTGATAMLDAGMLEHPVPQAALALHVLSGVPSGVVLCGSGIFMAGCIHFRITVQGIGCHGATPESGVDPICIAAHIYLALQELVAREVSGKTALTVTVGRFHAGQGSNAIPGEAILEGTIRAFDEKCADWAFSRIDTMATNIAKAFRGTAKTQILSQTLPLENDPQLADWASYQIRKLLGEQVVYPIPEGGMGAEDFAAVTHRVPSVYLLLGAGSQEEGERYGLPMHNEKVIFQESILPKGAAIHTWCAMQWLENANKKAAHL